MRKSMRKPRLGPVVIAGLVALAIVATVGLTGCRPREEALPETPEEMAVNYFGAPQPGTLEPGVYQAGVDAAGEFTVFIRYGVSSGNVVSELEPRLASLLRDSFRYEQVQGVSVQVDFPFRDEDGNITLEKGLTLRLGRAKAEGIDWATLDPASLPGTVDEWWLDARLE